MPRKLPTKYARELTRIQKLLANESGVTRVGMTGDGRLIVYFAQSTSPKTRSQRPDSVDKRVLSKLQKLRWRESHVADEFTVYKNNGTPADWAKAFKSFAKNVIPKAAKARRNPSAFKRCVAKVTASAKRTGYDLKSAGGVCYAAGKRKYGKAGMKKLAAAGRARRARNNPSDPRFRAHGLISGSYMFSYLSDRHWTGDNGRKFDFLYEGWQLIITPSGQAYTFSFQRVPLDSFSTTRSSPTKLLRQYPWVLGVLDRNGEMRSLEQGAAEKLSLDDMVTLDEMLRLAKHHPPFVAERVRQNPSFQVKLAYAHGLTRAYTMHTDVPVQGYSPFGRKARIGWILKITQARGPGLKIQIGRAEVNSDDGQATTLATAADGRLFSDGTFEFSNEELARVDMSDIMAMQDMIDQLASQYVFHDMLGMERPSR